MPKERVSVMISAIELKAIDDWRGRKDKPASRPEAVRKLIELGIAAELKHTGKENGGARA